MKTLPSYSDKRRANEEMLSRTAMNTYTSEQVCICAYSTRKLSLTTPGDAAKRFAVLPAKRALHNLVNNATSSEEWQRAIELLKQWRRYPARAVPTGIQELFIREYLDID